MTWFRVDDQFHSNNKIRKLAAEDPAALGLWVVAGSWSGAALTDGFVPDYQIPSLVPAGSDELAKKLVAARLWKRVKGGYQFHDWGRWQPSKDEVELKRKKEGRRTALGRDGILRAAVRLRDKERCRFCGVKVRWNDRRGLEGGTYNYVDPDGKTTTENVVVSCRGCDLAKGEHTVAKAGMQLLPPGSIGPSGSKSGSKSEPGSDHRKKPSTRHDPTRPPLKGEGAGDVASPAQPDPGGEELNPADRDERDWRWRPDEDPETIHERNKRGAAAIRALTRSTDREDPSRAEQRDQRLARNGGIDPPTVLLPVLQPSLMIVQSRGTTYDGRRRPMGKHAAKTDDQEEAS